MMIVRFTLPDPMPPTLTTAMTLERVRRAEAGLELLGRYLPAAATSEPGAAGQALISPSVR
jgi:hypothetical protein